MPKQADAVLIPGGMAQRLHPKQPSRLAWYKCEFGPVLDSPRVWSRYCGPGQADVLLTADPDSSPGAPGYRFHEDGHPLAGQERYTWQDRGDGILYGTLEAADATA